MAEVRKMERKFRLTVDLDGRTVEDREAYFHGAEFRLGIYVFMSETIDRFRNFADLDDVLAMTFRNETWTIKRIE